MATKAHTISRSQSGSALVVALIMMIVLTLIALASSYTSIFEIRISGNQRGSTDALYGTDAGINIIAAYTQNFSQDLTAYNITPYAFTTGSTCNPLPALQNDGTIPAPIKEILSNLSSTNTNITYSGQLGPPRGIGFSAINLNYAYYQIQSTGNDSAGSGATTAIQEDIVRILPLP